MRFSKSQPHRIEDDALLRGSGSFSDDVSYKNQVHSYILRSVWAAAKIVSIDITAALKSPGVLKIYLAEDLAARGMGGIPETTSVMKKFGKYRSSIPLLALDRVRYFGEGIAFVVAKTLAQAKQAAAAIQIEFAEETPVVDLLEASASKTLVHDKAQSNIAFDWDMGDIEKTRKIINSCTHKVSLTLVNNRLISCPMEPRSALGKYQDGMFTLHTPTQGTHGIRDHIAATLNLDKPQDLRVISKDVGGGFGTRAFSYPEHALVLNAARDLGVPVKWLGEKSYDIFVSDVHGRDHSSTLEIGFDDQFKVAAYFMDTLAGMGAYLSSFAAFIPTLAPKKVFTGVYRIPQFASRVRGVYTNTSPVDAYRGAGRPEAAYALERLFDFAASTLNIDRFELRKRNFIEPEHLPYATPGGGEIDSGDFPKVFGDCLSKLKLDAFPQRREEAESRGKLLGLGLAYYIEACGKGDGETAYLEMDDNAKLTLRIGSQTNGQGHATMYTRLLADNLGLASKSISVVQGDSKLVPSGEGTGGSRGLAEAGGAVFKGAGELTALGVRALAAELDCKKDSIALEDGIFKQSGSNKSYSWDEVAALAKKHNIKLKVAAFNNNKESSFSNGCHAAEVEIDTLTGAWRVVRYLALDDFGTIVNPDLAAGQVHGGVVQGLGQALLERTVYDTNGQLLSGSLMDYCLPRAGDVPNIELDFFEGAPCSYNPLGVKGAGEAGSIASPPALVNAVVDAIATATGNKVQHLDMPLTSQTIWRALRNS